MRILIADDSAEVAERLSELLADLPSVETIGPAPNGNEALRLFEKFAPNGAVLDLQMPGLNGLEVLTAIRKRNKSCPVIILTNHEGEEIRSRCLKSGANFFLHKSTEFERVRDIIRKHVEECA